MADTRITLPFTTTLRLISEPLLFICLLLTPSLPEAPPIAVASNSRPNFVATSFQRLARVLRIHLFINTYTKAAQTNVDLLCLARTRCRRSSLRRLFSAATINILAEPARSLADTSRDGDEAESGDEAEFAPRKLGLSSFGADSGNAGNKLVGSLLNPLRVSGDAGAVVITCGSGTRIICAKVTYEKSLRKTAPYLFVLLLFLLLEYFYLFPVLLYLAKSCDLRSESVVLE